MHRSLDKHGEIPSNKLGSHDHLELDQPLFLYPRFIGLWEHIALRFILESVPGIIPPVCLISKRQF